MRARLAWNKLFLEGTMLSTAALLPVLCLVNLLRWKALSGIPRAASICLCVISLKMVLLRPRRLEGIRETYPVIEFTPLAFAIVVLVPSSNIAPTISVFPLYIVAPHILPSIPLAIICH
jgi:hypothetical protein